MFFFLLFYFVLVGGRISLCSPGWLGTHDIDQTGFLLSPGIKGTHILAGCLGRWVYLYELEASWSYQVSSRPTKVKEREPLSKNKKENKTEVYTTIPG